MNTPQDLHERLAREADGFFRHGGTTLELDQVLDRAGEIKRGRRMRATLLMAACVLAIAVPTVLVAIDRDATTEPTPAQRHRVDRTPLTLAGLAAGPSPRTGYIQDGTLHLDGFTYRFDGEHLVAFAPFHGGVLVASRDGRGNLRARRLDGSRVPMSGEFATSRDGGAAAFVRPDGTPVVARKSGDLDLPTVPAAAVDGASAVAVSVGCAQTSTADCAVWVVVPGRQPSMWVSRAGGTADQLGIDGANLVGPDDRVAGTVSTTDTGSCSAVKTLDGATVWQTCEHSLVSFSPDGRHLLAGPAYRDGAGDRELAVLDASSGKALLDLSTAGEGFVQQVVWEDAGHLLATMSEGGRWAVVRIGLDGHREYAVPPVTGGDPYESPFALTTR